ncbi:hypothetical protein DLAC_06392 [Tieghemostelium lacteum]|uniref:Uncharacterized protein n=1 Tax=Tieghemostelium lacteum TaxID=361077 RepID=A0A151ZEN4_TIELA|nr:hypothetical protein DLAC_06392 [Tieghemostelium lacteum]|eukprot:KYQ92413.1 hypothetical protein DLAC_06392 [Tieghemostelium lacteum]
MRNHRDGTGQNNKYIRLVYYHKRKLYIILFLALLILFIIRSLGDGRNDNVQLNTNISIQFDRFNVYTPTETYDKEEDSLYSLMMSDYFQSKLLYKNLAVVIPFPEKHLEKTLNAIKRWDQVDRMPCDPSLLVNGKVYSKLSKFLPDLIFYTNFGRNQKIIDQITDLINESQWKQCFKSLQFIHANLTEEEDGYPRGPANQFVKFYDMPISRDYQYFFYMENDVVPIRRGWVLEIVRLTYMTEATRRRPFMAIGSTVREKEAFKRKVIQRFHVNGNAIWSTSEQMRKFLTLVQEYYQPHYGKGLMWYDGEFFEYLLDSRNWLVSSVIYQDFIFYDFLQNYSQWPYNETLIKQDFPSTYLIHGLNNINSK